jgi:regulator of sigma E protease
MDLDSISTILKAALGIGLVIFVHELGHFLAARWCRVRVEVFSIGMGPRLFSWVRGKTRYQLAMIPIGGYVRMAGEDRRLDGLPPEPDDLSSKSVGARFFIYSGGVLMNVLFGLVVFPIIFYVGVPFTRPVIGDPPPGGAAWKAGIPAGSEVLAVNGREVFEHMHVHSAVALGDPSGTELLLRTPDGELRREHLVPRYDEEGGLYTIDIGLPYVRGPHGGFVLEVPPDSPLARAGVQSGEELLGVAGAPPGLSVMEELRFAATGGPLELRIGDAAGETVRTVTAEDVAGPLQPPRIGVFPPHNEVAGLRGRALAAEGIQTGDRLLAVGQTPIQRVGDLGRALLAPFEDATAAEAAVELDFVLQRDGARRTGAFHLTSRADALALARDLALRTDLESTTVLVSPGEPAALAGVRDGDRVLSIGGVETRGWADTRELIQGQVQQGAPIRLELAREVGGVLRTTHADVTPAELPFPDYGVVFVQDVYEFRATSVLGAVHAGWTCSLRFAEDVVVTLKRMITRDLSFKNTGGIITISIVSHTFAESGWTKLFFFLCMLSINLAIINVLPIPLLDGGHLTFLIIEKLKGSPVSERVLVYSQVVGLVLILSLLVLITYQDVVRWFLPPA